MHADTLRTAKQRRSSLLKLMKRAALMRHADVRMFAGCTCWWRPASAVSIRQSCPVIRAWVCGIEGSGARSFADSLATVETTIIRSADLPIDLPDVCIVVASAEQGFSPVVADAWHRCAEDFIPRICVWTHIDSGRTDDDELRAMAERVLEEEVYPLALPISGDDEEFVALLDLPGQEIHIGDSDVSPSDTEHVSLSAGLREELISAAAATTDDASVIDQLNLGFVLDSQRAWQLVASAVRTGQLAVAVPTRPIEPKIGIRLVERFLASLA